MTLIFLTFLLRNVFLRILRTNILIFCFVILLINTAAVIDRSSSCHVFKRYFGSFGLRFLTHFHFNPVHAYAYRLDRCSASLPWSLQLISFHFSSPHVWSWSAETWRRPRLMSKLFLPRSLQVNVQPHSLIISCSHMILSLYGAALFSH